MKGSIFLLDFLNAMDSPLYDLLLVYFFSSSFLTSEMETDPSSENNFPSGISRALAIFCICGHGRGNFRVFYLRKHGNGNFSSFAYLG